jgi:DNA-binding NtrC family response regulator
MTVRVLVVEDEAGIRLALRGLLRKEGYDVELAQDGAEAVRKLAEGAFDLVLTDLAMGAGPSGMDVLRAAKERRRETAVVMITAHGSEKIAVEAMKAGAEDYVPKPFDNDELRLVVTRALERTRLEREHRLLLERVERDFGFERLIGTGAAMRRVFEMIEKVAQTDLSVLVHGESGTGKELVAQALHQRSSRRERPFVAVNCAAISRDLVESELFGHERGAFTGAGARRTGKFESAHGGSIFLDEIGDMAAETQAKVLRVLQERAFERVGGDETLQVDVRVIAATHRDLLAEVEAGRFREDLYYRLRVVEIVVPPLRERREDIPALAERFLEDVSARLQRPRKQIGADALRALMAQPLRGNVRELRNLIERAAVLASADVIGESDLGLARDRAPSGPRAVDERAMAARAGDARADASAGDAPGALPFREAKLKMTEHFERSYLLRALEAHGWNVSRTADAIGMVRQTLQQKIRELALREPGSSGDD